MQNAEGLSSNKCVSLSPSTLPKSNIPEQRSQCSQHIPRSSPFIYVDYLLGNSFLFCVASQLSPLGYQMEYHHLENLLFLQIVPCLVLCSHCSLNAFILFCPLARNYHNCLFYVCLPHQTLSPIRVRDSFGPHCVYQSLVLCTVGCSI